MSVHAGTCFFDRPTSKADLAPNGACEPLRSASGLVMMWDGRLDNADDLRRRLGGAASDESDAALALATFERDGVDGLRSLIGDWSAAVWDAPLRTLYLARDYMGVRPLYYGRGERSVSWSSSLGDLVLRTGRTEELDERFVAGFMALHVPTDATPYRGIHAVPCACAIRLSDTGESRQRFWDIEDATIRYRDRRNYEDHLRAIWTDAVRTRLRTTGTVWAELSGGLDSSSIVCTANALVKQGAVRAAAIQPISHVTFESREGDERAFVDVVDSWTGLTTTMLGVEEHQDLRDDDDWATPLAARGIQVASERHVADRGGRVILSGRMGDLVMGCSSDNTVAVFDDFAAWRFGAALSKIRLWSRSCRKPYVEVAWTLGRAAARTCFTRRTSVAASGARASAIALLTPRLQALAHAQLAEEPAPRVRLAAQPLAAAVLACSREARLENRTADPRVSYSYPFAHRPLVEFMLAIPAEELSAPGATRALMRRAFTGIVPDRVLRRQSKGCYPPAVMRAVRRTLAALPPPEELEIVRRGWLNVARLTDALRDMAHAGSRAGAEVQRALILEDWLARRHRRGPAAIPQREEVRHHGVCNA